MNGGISYGIEQHVCLVGVEVMKMWVFEEDSRKILCVDDSQRTLDGGM